jgi:hypothetical protein
VSSLLEAAMSYACREWRVLRVRARSKEPVDKGWPSRATTKRVAMREWFADSDYNIGIATGPESGLLVLDVDGDPRKLLKNHDVPNTAAQRTGGGGVQFLFSWPRELDGATTTRVGVLPSVDTRGGGGYVVAPPSVHPSGRRYAWLAGCGPDVELAEPPDWLIELLTMRPTGERTPDAEWRRIAGEGAREGERNTTLARLAGHLLSRRDIDPVVARELLLAWSQARCAPPMPERQALRTIQSIAAKELAKWPQ